MNTTTNQPARSIQVGDCIPTWGEVSEITQDGYRFNGMGAVVRADHVIPYGVWGHWGIETACR